MAGLTIGLGSLGLLGGGTGIAAAGLAAAGAIGLGLLAAAKLFGGRRRGGGRQRKHRGGGGRGRGGGGHGRYGRQTDEVKEEELEALKTTLDLIHRQDITGCGMKLMCELAELKEEDLDQEQLAILNLVSPMEKAGEWTLLPGGAQDYMAAKHAGLRHTDCSLAFPLCNWNGTELMNIVELYLP